MRIILILIAFTSIVGCAASSGTISEAPPVGPERRQTDVERWKPPYQEIADAFYQSLNRMIGYKQAKSAVEPSRIRHIRPKLRKERRRAAATETPFVRASAETLYKNAYHLYTVGEYAKSRSGFHAFLESFPSNGLSDNAWYWIGECYYAEGDYGSAVRAFDTVLSRFEDGNKRSDALLKIGLSHLKSGEAGEAGEFLTQVVKFYPGSDASAIATKLLRQR